MPAAEATVTARFTRSTPCLPLQMLTSGSGSVAPSPLQSEGCGENEYQPGETIVLTATPRTGVFFGGWSTTLGPVLDCGSCAAATLVMPSIAIA